MCTYWRWSRKFWKRSVYLQNRFRQPEPAQPASPASRASHRCTFELHFTWSILLLPSYCDVLLFDPLHCLQYYFQFCEISSFAPQYFATSRRFGAISYPFVEFRKIWQDFVQFRKIPQNWEFTRPITIHNWRIPDIFGKPGKFRVTGKPAISACREILLTRKKLRHALGYSRCNLYNRERAIKNLTIHTYI